MSASDPIHGLANSAKATELGRRDSPLFATLKAADRRRRQDLREEVLAHLEDQGFKVSASGVLGAIETDKGRLRDLHSESVLALRLRAKRGLARRESALLDRLGTGFDVRPSRIRPRLVLVDDRQSMDGMLWRWTSLHWSIPVSSGYGRRLRFLVIDDGHDGALMGLIGLGDPVFALRSRDEAIGWTAAQRAHRLACVMDAFVLGAVPPYSQLLGGKLMALLASSSEIQTVFREKYGHKKTLIAERDPDASLALVTTVSALGRSSVYNRLKRSDGSLAMEPVGFTSGTGDFHFSGGIYAKLAEFAAELDPDKGTHRHERWGAPGFRNRREVLHLSLAALGFDARALRSHGVQRQVFLGRVAPNTFEFLRGDSDELEVRDSESADELASWWLQRWAVPRSRTHSDWLEAKPENWRLYN